MRNLLKILLTTLLSLACITIVQSDTLTLQRADGSSYEMEGEVEHYRDNKFVVAFGSGGKMSLSLKQVQKIEFSRSFAKTSTFEDSLTLEKGNGTSYIFKSRVNRYDDNKFAVVSSSGAEAIFSVDQVQKIEFGEVQDENSTETSKSHIAGPGVEKNIAKDGKLEDEADDTEGERKKQTDQIIEKLTDAGNICKYLQADLGNEGYLKKLQSTFEDIDDKDIKGYLGCTFIMGYFYMGDNKAARKFRQNFEEQFPNCSYLKLIQSENLGATCNKCDGDGKVNVKCPRCKGSGVCTMCKGQGSLRSSITDEKTKCPKCQGTGDCKKCKGTGQVSRMCRECRGEGTVISKARIEEVYVALLSKSIEQLFIAEQVARGVVKIEDSRTLKTISQIQAESEEKESDELIAKLKNCEVAYYAYDTTRVLGISLWELIVETSLFKDGEGKQIKSNLSVNGNKVSLKLTTETGNMVFNFRLQERIAILCNSTINLKTIDALAAVGVLAVLMEDVQASNPTQDEMKKARVAARKMLSNDSESGESAIGMETILAFWLFFALVGMAIGIRKGMHPAVAFIGSLLLGILAPLMVFVTTTVKKCPQCTEQVKKNALVCKHCGYKFSKIETMRVSCPLCGREFDCQVDATKKGTVRLRIKCPHCKQKSFKSVRIQAKTIQKED